MSFTQYSNNYFHLQNDMLKQFETINKQLQTIEQLLQSLDSRLITIEQKLEICEKSSKHLDEHIDFVENVYETISTPLNFACNKINKYINKSITNN